jgi:hypothetical protein
MELPSNNERKLCHELGAERFVSTNFCLFSGSMFIWWGISIGYYGYSTMKNIH